MKKLYIASSIGFLIITSVDAQSNLTALGLASSANIGEATEDGEKLINVACDGKPHDRHGWGYANKSFKLPLGPSRNSVSFTSRCDLNLTNLPRLKEKLQRGLTDELRNDPYVKSLIAQTESTANQQCNDELSVTHFRNSEPICEAPTYPGRDDRNIYQGKCAGGWPGPRTQSEALKCKDIGKPCSIWSLSFKAFLEDFSNLVADCSSTTNWGDGTCSFTCHLSPDPVAAIGYINVTSHGVGCYVASPVCVFGE